MIKKLKSMTAIFSILLLMVIAVNAPINDNPIAPMCDEPPIDISQ